MDRRYRAYLTRDPRFDGRFFVAVVTTGIYCRPICPAPSPRPRNVRFFACAAAAEAAGFRACRRCRPETSPGTPAWLGTSATVNRALRLIAAGALDESGVEDLSQRLGVGSRHLRRLVFQHVGATPLAIARTRRIHFARSLIDDTQLPMTRIALHAGFASLRTFNHAIRQSFERSPTELRRRAKTAPPNGGLSGKLAYRPPFDWRGLIGFLGARAVPGVESVTGDEYRRTIEVGGAACVLSVRALRGEHALLASVESSDATHLLEIVSRIRRMFDLDADPLAIDRTLGRDPVLARALRGRRGLRVPGSWDPFELAVRAVLGQQVTVAAARTLAGRAAQRFGRSLAETRFGLTHLFPTAGELAEARLETIGLTRARAETIRRLATAVVRGELGLDAFASLEETVARLRRIPGVGEWTAEYVAMRALGEPDAFPASDLGLRRALADGAGPIPAPELRRIAERWRPWRAYAAIALWTNGKET